MEEWEFQPHDTDSLQPLSQLLTHLKNKVFRIKVGANLFDICLTSWLINSIKQHQKQTQIYSIPWKGKLKSCPNKGIHWCLDVVESWMRSNGPTRPDFKLFRLILLIPIVKKVHFEKYILAKERTGFANNNQPLKTYSVVENTLELIPFKTLCYSLISLSCSILWTFRNAQIVKALFKRIITRDFLLLKGRAYYCSNTKGKTTLMYSKRVLLDDKDNVK